MSKIFTLIITLMFITSAECQIQFSRNVISSSGEVQVNSDFIFSYSFGEVFTESLTDVNNLFTQGFQQPDKHKIIGLISTDPSVGLETIDLSEYIVYPNPFLDVLFIKNTFQENLNATAAVYNMMGQKMTESQLSPFNNQIDLSSLESGTYYLNIESSAKSYSCKIIKSE